MLLTMGVFGVAGCMLGCTQERGLSHGMNAKWEVMPTFQPTVLLLHRSFQCRFAVKRIFTDAVCRRHAS
jgi:hypothetical protein